jgi:hypothetical protein
MKERKPDVDRYKRNAKKRASGNIQTQNRVYEGHPRHGPKMVGVGNPLCPFCNTYLVQRN